MSKAIKTDYSNDEIDAMIDEFLQKIEMLRIRYEQYFCGAEKKAPTQLRMDCVRLMRLFEQLSVQNTTTKFRIRTATQKLTSYMTYWNRTLREIEDGTYKRHVAKAKREQSLLEQQKPQSRSTSREEAENTSPGATVTSRAPSAAVSSAGAEAEAFLASMGFGNIGGGVDTPRPAVPSMPQAARPAVPPMPQATISASAQRAAVPPMPQATISASAQRTAVPLKPQATISVSSQKPAITGMPQPSVSSSRIDNTVTKPTNLTPPRPAVSQPVAPRPAVSQPVAPRPAVSQPVAPRPAVSQPVAPRPAVSQPVAPRPAAAQPVAPRPAVPQPVAPRPAAAQPVAPEAPKRPLITARTTARPGAPTRFNPNNRNS